MLRIGSIVLRVDDLQRQTEFWEAALGYVRHDMDHDFTAPAEGWCRAESVARPGSLDSASAATHPP